MESIYHKHSNMFRLLNKVLFGGDSTWMGDQIRIPLVVITFFCFVFFPFLFQGDIKESKNCYPCVMSVFSPCLSTLCSSFGYGHIMCVSYKYLLHITREFYSIKLICTNLYALFSHLKKAYTTNQNCVQLFHMWKYNQSTIA